MTKITADHLDRGAFVYIRQSTADQLLHNLESRRRQYGSLIGPGSSVGRPSRSSTMILAAQAVASIGRASTACWQRSAKAASVRYSRSKRRGWLATVATGTR